MKPIKFDLGMYCLSKPSVGYSSGCVTGICPKCGNDMGYVIPMLNVNEGYATLFISCPSCGVQHNLWHGTGAKNECEPKSSQAPTVADF